MIDPESWNCRGVRWHYKVEFSFFAVASEVVASYKSVFGIWCICQLFVPGIHSQPTGRGSELQEV